MQLQQCSLNVIHILQSKFNYIADTLFFKPLK